MIELKQWIEEQVTFVHPVVGNSSYFEYVENGFSKTVIYKTHTSGGVKVEGNVTPLLCDNEENAKYYFKLNFLKLLGTEKSKKLYWRTFPIVYCTSVNGIVYYWVHARLSVEEYYE